MMASIGSFRTLGFAGSGWFGGKGRGGNGSNRCSRRQGGDRGDGRGNGRGGRRGGGDEDLREFWGDSHRKFGMFGVTGNSSKPFDGFVGEPSSMSEGGLDGSLRVSSEDIGASPAFVESSTRPVVVILSWMGANRKNIQKYTELYRERGYDVYFYLNNMAHAMIPMETRRQANRVLETISSIPPNRPVFVHAFSIGTGIYGYVLNMMKEKQQKMSNLAGVIYDSGPSMIFPTDVARGLHLVCPKVSKAVWDVVAKSLFAVTQARKNFNVAEEALAKFQLPHVPQLYIYSLDDKIIPKVADSIGHFVEENRRRGVETFCKVWEKSKHATHLRYHPEEYTENVAVFLQRCLERRGVDATPLKTGT